MDLSAKDLLNVCMIDLQEAIEVIDENSDEAISAILAVEVSLREAHLKLWTAKHNA